MQGSAGWRKLEEEKKEIRNPPESRGIAAGVGTVPVGPGRAGRLPVTGSEKGAFQMARD